MRGIEFHEYTHDVCRRYIELYGFGYDEVVAFFATSGSNEE